MAKLRGKAKAAFLAKMAAGRARARGGPGRRRPARRRRRNSELMVVGNPRRRGARRRNQLGTCAYCGSQGGVFPDWQHATHCPRYRKPKRRVLTIRAKRRPRPAANPADRLARARAAYRTFHGVNPRQVRRIGAGDGVLISLGELREIVYQPRRGHRRGPAWFHKFKAGAVLATTPDGKSLVIVDRKKGQRAVDFERGIVR